jgi:hypothetical protein
MKCPFCNAPRVEQNDLVKELGKGFSEAQEIIINTMIERKIAEAIDKLLDDYDIHEKPLLNEEREEDYAKM